MMTTDSLSALIDRVVPADGVSDTPLDGVQLFRITEPIERIPGVYPPSVCAILRGSKRAFYDGATHVYDARQYLCNTMPLPVEAEVPAASPENPVLGVLVSLETTTMAETMVAYETAQDSSTEAQVSGPGLVVAEWDETSRDALERLLAVLDDPVALQVLGSARLREFLFTILRGPAGPVLLQRLGKSSRVSRAVRHLRDHLAEPLTVDELAAHVGMSRAVFHRRFKEATSQAPLQFIKSMRLNEAAMLMTQGLNVSSAAARVGYSNRSQFSREFRRQFGRSPREWRAGAESAVDVQSSLS